MLRRDLHSDARTPPRCIMVSFGDSVACTRKREGHQHASRRCSCTQKRRSSVSTAETPTSTSVSMSCKVKLRDSLTITSSSQGAPMRPWCQMRLRSPQTLFRRMVMFLANGVAFRPPRNGTLRLLPSLWNLVQAQNPQTMEQL